RLSHPGAQGPVLPIKLEHHMHSLVKARLRNWSVAALLPWLAACAAITPGMHVGSKHAPKEAAPEITPIVKGITPQLLQAEKEARAKDAGPDLSALLSPPAPYRIGRGDVLNFVVRNQPTFSTVAGQAPGSSAE